MKDYKRVKLPKGLVRARIVENEPGTKKQSAEYDKLLEADYDAHRAEYREVIMYGVPVLVKVESDEGQEFRFYSQHENKTK